VAGARLAALEALLGVDRGSDMIDAAGDIMRASLCANAVLNPILTATATPVSGYFAGLTSSIARQLLAIAKVVEARATFGARRQVFLVSLGSFDTHSNELATQDTLFRELGPALKVFTDAMTGIGARASVTSFTLSDFARTLKPNTTGGTDHAWGNHHFVAGGAVKGRQIYRTMPALELGGPDDEGQEGRGSRRWPWTSMRPPSPAGSASIRLELRACCPSSRHSRPRRWASSSDQHNSPDRSGRASARRDGLDLEAKPAVLPVSDQEAYDHPLAGQ
jgi:hypothetical protein